MKVLLAVDGSAFTQKMLAYLVSHPELLVDSRHYTALTVQAPLPPRAKALVGKADVDAYYAEESDKVLTAVASTLNQHGVQLERASRIGSAGEEIARFAKDGQFDLIVIGSHGHGSFSNLVMGSVATKVLAACDVPVMLIR